MTHNTLYLKSFSILLGCICHWIEDEYILNGREDGRTRRVLTPVPPSMRPVLTVMRRSVSASPSPDSASDTAFAMVRSTASGNEGVRSSSPRTAPSASTSVSTVDERGGPRLDARRETLLRGAGAHGKPRVAAVRAGRTRIPVATLVAAGMIGSTLTMKWRTVAM